jgi:hypothetical protein
MMKSELLIRTREKNRVRWRKKLMDNCYAAYFLERIGDSRAVVPTNENRSPDRYSLRLKDRKGKLLAEI